jgi:hypothetical protein
MYSVYYFLQNQGLQIYQIIENFMQRLKTIFLNIFLF